MNTFDTIEQLHEEHTLPFLLLLLHRYEAEKAKKLTGKFAKCHSEAAVLLQELARKVEDLEQATYYYGRTEEQVSVLAMACGTTKPLGME